MLQQLVAGVASPFGSDVWCVDESSFNLESQRLSISTEAVQWVPAGSHAAASVNSFGFGGTSCHVALIHRREPSSGASETSGGEHLALVPFVHSAASPQAPQRTIEHTLKRLGTSTREAETLQALGNASSVLRSHGDGQVVVHGSRFACAARDLDG